MSKPARTPALAWSARGRLAGWAAELAGPCADWLAEAALRAGLDARHELSLVICDPAFIRRLNRRWRGKDAPTDVLSFPLQELRPGQPAEAGPLGDIVIAPAVARRDAVAAGADVRAHLQLLLTHGLLHLLGYDHMTDKEALVMEKREREILAGGLEVPDRSRAK